MLVKQIKTIAAKTGIARNVLFGRYPYMYSPLQIRKLIDCCEEKKNIPGSYVEIGCAYGATAILMAKTFNELGIERQCYALDTFSGFVETQATHDIVKLGKDPELKNYFRSNDISWLRASLADSGIDNFQIFKGDASVFDYSRCGPIALALLDVDLYLPIYSILPQLYKNLSPGGLIIVDDCAPSTKWEGALLAYQKFTDENGIEQNIVCGKLGIIRRANS